MNEDESTVSLLQAAQERHGYLPEDAIYEIAARQGVSPAKVMGVATFYSQFRLKPVGRYLVLLCKGTACHVNGADGVAAAIREDLGVDDGGTTADGLFTLKFVACLGCCSLSPVMMVNGTAYGSLTPEKARRILADLRKDAAKAGEARA